MNALLFISIAVMLNFCSSALPSPSYGDVQELMNDYQGIDSPVCADLILDLNREAISHGMESKIVLIKLRENYHTVLSFNTTDKGKVCVDLTRSKQIYSRDDIMNRYGGVK